MYLTRAGRKILYQAICFCRKHSFYPPIGDSCGTIFLFFGSPSHRIIFFAPFLFSSSFSPLLGVADPGITLKQGFSSSSPPLRYGTFFFHRENILQPFLPSSTRIESVEKKCDAETFIYLFFLIFSPVMIAIRCKSTTREQTAENLPAR